MGPSINTIFPPFEVAYVIESGKMSCVKVITQFLRTNLLCLMVLTCEDCCGFIYSDSSQTDCFFHFAQMSELFSISLRLYITPAEVSSLEGGEVGALQGKLDFECSVTMVDNFTSW